VARYSNDGTLAWAKRAGGVAHDMARGIAALDDGSCLATGWFAGSATFGAGDPKQTLLGSRGGRDVFVARFNADGGF
jgi:hypothetical protein